MLPWAASCCLRPPPCAVSAPAPLATPLPAPSPPKNSPRLSLLLPAPAGSGRLGPARVHLGPAWIGLGRLGKIWRHVNADDSDGFGFMIQRPAAVPGPGLLCPGIARPPSSSGVRATPPKQQRLVSRSSISTRVRTHTHTHTHTQVLDYSEFTSLIKVVLPGGKGVGGCHVASRSTVLSVRCHVGRCGRGGGGGVALNRQQPRAGVPGLAPRTPPPRDGVLCLCGTAAAQWAARRLAVRTPFCLS